MDNAITNYYLTPGDLPSWNHFSHLMDTFTTRCLKGTSETEFQNGLKELINRSYPEFINYKDLSIQRDMSTQFTWGHDHDFGAFKMKGKMDMRHVKHLSIFHDHFDALPYDLVGKKVLDIGCWTGGVSLLLAASGAEVTAIDEVGKYCECLNFLARSFGIESLEARKMSLYELNDPRFYDRFDIVIFAGVLYHITDVVVAMRIIFNSLKDGGSCLVESTGVNSEASYFAYDRRKWNWLDPTPAALKLLMKDVGFAEPVVGRVTHDERLYGVGRRAQHVDMRRDGLSVPAIR